MFGKSDQQKVTLNGQELEVRNLEVSYSIDGLPSVSVEGFLNPARDYSGEMTFTAESSAADVMKQMLGDHLVKGGKSAYQYGVDTSTHTSDSLAYAWTSTAGTQRNISIKELNKMRGYDNEKACEDESDYGARQLAKKVVNLELDDRQKLIKKFNLKRDDGTLTERGRELLLTLLFDIYEDEVVDALTSLDAVEQRPDTCGC